jgi:ABC-2 type transport system ATP-binding protein
VLQERFAIDAVLSEGLVSFHVAGGEQFVPRMFAELGVAINSVNVARPTLDDVFMKYTGRTIRDAEASTSQRNRSSVMVRAGRAR